MNTPVSSYLFASSRLGFRSWQDADLQKLAAINTDPEVMEFFPSTVSMEQTLAFIDRMKASFSGKGFCYFAVDLIESGEFIGFIGLMEKDFEADFTPCVDIGWRLDKRVWNKGYATEGALRCLQFAFDDLALKEVYSIAPEINAKSELIMKKIGMKKEKKFSHPLLANAPHLQNCILYKITRPD